MRPIRLTIENFLSFADQQTVELADKGLVAVFGRNLDQGADSNGAGKSTVLEALFWALYGRTLRGYKGDAVINRHTGKNCIVTLELEDQGRQYVVSRWRKRSRVKRAADVRLEVAGKDISMGTMDDTQEQINTLLGMDADTFSQSVLLWHGNQSFSQMTDKQQKDLLEDILQVGALSRARQVVSTRMAAKQGELVKVSTLLDRIQADLDAQHVAVDKYRRDRDAHAQTQRFRKLEIRQKKAKAEADMDQVYSDSGLVPLLALQEDYLTQSKDLRRRIDANQRAQLEATQRQATERAQAGTRAQMLEQHRDELAHSSAGVAHLVGKPCPTCAQVLAPDAAEETLKHIEGEKRKIETQLESVWKKSGVLDRKGAEVMAALYTERESLDERNDQVQGLLRSASEKISKRSAALATICQLEQTVFNYQAQIDDMDDTANPYESLVVDAEAELNSLVRERWFRRMTKRALESELKHLSYWSHGFSNHGMKSFLLDSVLPFLNERAQHYADILTGGAIKIEFATTTQKKSGAVKDEFQVRVINTSGADVYHGNSDGEKRRIDLAVGWALGDLAATRSQKSIEFKGLDEPFESLDETGEESVIRLLHSVLPEYGTVLCITHSAHLQSQFSNTLTVTKTNGQSRIA